MQSAYRAGNDPSAAEGGGERTREGVTWEGD